MKRFLLWALAVVLTLTAAVYQRMTGPTYPKRIKLGIEGTIYSLRLLRTQELPSDATVSLRIPDHTVRGTIHFRPYPTSKSWELNEMLRDGEDLKGLLPAQPAAGKLEYYVILEKEGQAIPVSRDEPVVIRFKGPVPSAFLLPHVLLMFLAMLFSVAAALFALMKLPVYRLYTNITFWLLLAGGMIMGPVIQKYAFGDLWTGIPFGWDLTDNKTLIAFLAFLIAYLGNRRKERPVLTIIATVILLAVYSIPHSLFGSQLDHETGKIIQGIILFF